MADNSIALQVQTPSFVNTVGDWIGLRSKQQGLQQQQQQIQSGQQTIESQDINLQVARQANQERKNWISMVQQNPSLMPREDGTVDTGPRNMALIRQGMPQTGDAKIQEITKSNQDIAAARQSMQNLGKDTLNTVSKGMFAVANEPESVQLAAKTAMIAAIPGTKPLFDALDNATALAKDSASFHFGGDPKAISDVTSHVYKTFAKMPLDVAAQNTLKIPQYTDIGTVLKQVNPESSAPDLPKTLTPAELTSVGVAPGSNQPFITQRNPSGVGAQVSPAMVGGGAATQPPQAPLTTTAKPSTGVAQVRPAPLFPTPQDAATATAAQQRWQQVREQDSNPQSGYKATQQVYANLVPLVATAKVGPGAARFNQVTGSIATTLGLPANTPYQEVSAYLDRLSAQQSQSTGASTNFAREQAASATGTGEMNTDALAEKLRFGASINEASHAYATASQAFAGKHAQNAYYNSNAFDSAWTQNADPLAFRLRAAKANSDDADYKATFDRIKSMPLPKQHAVFEHYKNLSTLEAGDIPK